MPSVTDVLLDRLKEFLNLTKETCDENLITETYGMSEMPNFSVPKRAQHALIFCLNGSEIFMSANGIFFVAFFVARFSHDGLQETCHIAHACRSVLCGRDPPGGLKK